MTIDRFFTTKLFGYRHVKDSLGDELPDRGTLRIIGVPVTDDAEALETVIDMSSLPIGEGILELSAESPISVDNTDPSNPVISIDPATTSDAGSMSGADKLKLDGIGDNATVVSVVVIAPITRDNTDPANPIIGISAATPSVAGSMSAADKTKLDLLNPTGYVVSLGSTAPITIGGTSTTPIVGITAATGVAAGSMSAADKTTMNAATDANTASTLVKRSAAGAVAVSTLSATQVEATGSVFAADVSNPNGNLTLSCDGFGTITLDGASTGELLVPMPIQSAFYKFDGQKNLSRSIPLNWSSCKVGGVDSWNINDTSNLVCTVQDAFANLVIECRFVHGSHITGITIRNRGPAGGALPANPPTFSLYRKLLSTGVNSLVGTVNATLDGTYRGTSRDTLIDLSAGSGHIVDSELYRYFLVITPEFGADSLAGHIVYNAKVDYFLPSTFAIGMD